jgi:hypothetical protein
MMFPFLKGMPAKPEGVLYYLDLKKSSVLRTAPLKKEHKILRSLHSLRMTISICRHHQISHDEENSHEICQISHEDDETLISIERCQILDEKCHQIYHDEMVVETENDLVWEVILSKLVYWRMKNSKQCMMKFMHK